MTSTLIDRLHGVAEGKAIKVPCRAASVAEIALSGLQTIDGVTLADNDRVLVRAQSDAVRNGVYVASSGNWSRAADFDGNRDVVKGTRVAATSGTVNANKTFVVTTADPVVIDTSSIAFSEITEAVVDSGARIPSTPVITKTSTDALTTAVQGKLINCDPSAADFALTLPSAVAAADGFRAGFRHIGTGNEVTIVAASGEAINGKPSLALTARYEAWWLVSNGTTWAIDGHAAPFMSGAIPFLKIVDRLTSPPVSPTPGARYILNGAGSGDWSAYTQHDVLEANGQNGWIRYTPSEPWFAFVEDENLFTAYHTGAWNDQTGMPEPTSSTLKIAVFQEQQDNGTNGGTNIAGSWATRGLNTSVSNSINGASLSLSNGQMTLPAGDYLVIAHSEFRVINQVRLRMKSTTTATQILGTNSVNASSDNTSPIVSLVGYLDLSAPEIFELQYWATTAQAAIGLGSPNDDAEREVYSTVTILDLNSLQGPAGAQGAQGTEGFAGFKFTFSSSTNTASDPGAGILRANNANLTLVTQLAIDDVTAASGGTQNIDDMLLTWDDSTSTKKGRIKLSKIGAAENFALYDLDSLSDNSGWTQLNVTYVDHGGSLSNTDSVAVEFVPKGDKGDTGATGATGATGVTGATGASGPHSGLDYAFDDTGFAESNPGSGKLRFNNATLSSANEMYISKTGRNGEGLGTDIGRWDDASAAHKGHIRVFDISNRAKFIEADITSSLTDNTTYWKVPLANVTGGTAFTAPAVLDVFFSRGGADGSGNIGGSTGGNDNRLLRADGAGGTTLQASGIAVDDSDNMSGVASIAVSNTGLKVKDIDASHHLSIVPGSNLSADRTLTVTTGDGPIEIDLTDPGADRILFWDDSVGKWQALTLNASIEISGTTIRAIETHGIALSDETTVLTTGVNKATFSLPYAFTIIAVYATLNTASSSGTPTVDVNEGGASILLTKITIDANEKTSGTAATPTVISDPAIAAFAELGFDIDVAGTGAKGLKVFIEGYRT